MRRSWEVLAFYDVRRERVRRYLALFMIYHDIMRFYVSVHYAFAVTEVEGFEKLKHVVSNVEVDKLGV